MKSIPNQTRQHIVAHQKLCSYNAVGSVVSELLHNMFESAVFEKVENGCLALLPYYTRVFLEGQAIICHTGAIGKTNNRQWKIWILTRATKFKKCWWQNDWIQWWMDVFFTATTVTATTAWMNLNGGSYTAMTKWMERTYKEVVKQRRQNVWTLFTAMAGTKGMVWRRLDLNRGVFYLQWHDWNGSLVFYCDW